MDLSAMVHRRRKIDFLRKYSVCITQNTTLKSREPLMATKSVCGFESQTIAMILLVLHYLEI